MHKKKVVSNSVIGFSFKILMLVIGFVSRKIFIVFLGEEVLGLNSLYSNLLDLLNLADLGIGVAVQYQLYEPLVNKDYEKQSKILSAARKLYNRIGLCVFTAGIVLSFFIQWLIKESTYPISFIRLSFMISVSGVSIGYFFVHKLLFLQSDEELGLVNIIDLLAKIGTTIVSLVLTVIFHNYFLYLIINALYGLIGNLIIHVVFKKKYPNITSKDKSNQLESRYLTANLKNVVPMKLSNYVYNSTDNVIISKILGLVTVARYSNYMTIINGIMGIEYILGNVVTSSIGKIMKEKNNIKEVFDYYLLFQYVHFIFTNFCTVSITILITPFIQIWLGESFLLDVYILVLLIIDFFIHSMYQPAYVLFGAAGKFKDDKFITMISAVLNIIFSLVAVYFIGLSGVILGTIVSDIYIWIVRSYQMVGRFFKQSLHQYFLLMLKYTCLTIGSVAISIALIKLFVTENIYLEFIFRAIISVIIPNIISFFFTFKAKEFLTLKKMVQQKLNTIGDKR